MVGEGIMGCDLIPEVSQLKLQNHLYLCKAFKKISYDSGLSIEYIIISNVSRFSCNIGMSLVTSILL
jgi:hypothetical protein